MSTTGTYYLLIFLGLCTGLHAASPDHAYILASGYMLNVSSYIWSRNNAYRFGLDPNGAIVVRSEKGLLWYIGPPTSTVNELWMQNDANLVRYTKYTDRYGDTWKDTWSTGTDGMDFGQTTLIVGDDCDIMIKNEVGGLIWSAKKAAGGNAHTCQPPTDGSRPPRASNLLVDNLHIDVGVVIGMALGIMVSAVVALICWCATVDKFPTAPSQSIPTETATRRR
jgi:hypothetical protein